MMVWYSTISAYHVVCYVVWYTALFAALFTGHLGHLVDPARWLDLPAMKREAGGSNLSAVKG